MRSCKPRYQLLWPVVLQTKQELHPEQMPQKKQHMIAKSVLFCDFSQFILKFSKNLHIKIIENQHINSFDTEQTEPFKLAALNIFSAIENNYIGVVKALVNANEENLKLKNNDNKTPLYIVIHQNKKELLDYFLSKINIKHFPMAYLYLHKAIRSRNDILVMKLYHLGVDFNSVDDKGNNCYHVLFSFFNKNIEKCFNIGNFLIEKGIGGINKYNTDKWTPFHLAARYSSCDCLNWIYLTNKKLSRERKETFNINCKGKNNWTPLHLALSAYRYNESVFLINHGSDLFLKTTDGRRPRRVTNNFFLTKMVSTKEKEFYFKKYFEKRLTCSHSNNNNKHHQQQVNNQTIVNDDTVFDISIENKYHITRNNVQAISLSQFTSKHNATAFDQYFIVTETLLSQEASYMEKLKCLFLIRTEFSIIEIESVLTEVLEQCDLSNYKNNAVVIEICDIIMAYNLTHLSTLLMKIRNGLVFKKHMSLFNVITNVLSVLEGVDIGRFDAVIKGNLRRGKGRGVRNVRDEDNDDNDDDGEDDCSNSSKTEKNYLTYFEEEEETIKIEKNLYEEHNHMNKHNDESDSIIQYDDEVEY